MNFEGEKVNFYMEKIEPTRLAAIKKRARILAKYCEIASPTESDTAEHAAKIGVSPHRFYIMAKAWKLRPQIEQIGGASIKADRVPKIPREVLTILGDVMRDLGPSASLSKIDALVRKRCAAKSIEAPSPTAIHYRVMKLRSAQELPQDLVGHVIFQCRPQIPVRVDGKIRSPWLTGAIRLPSKRIVHPIVTIGEPEDVIAIIERLRGRLEEDIKGRNIFVGTTAFHALPTIVKKKVKPAGKALTASVLLGRRLDNLTILHRAHPDMDAKLARRVVGKLNTALDPDEAKELILNAVASHNANGKNE